MLIIPAIDIKNGKCVRLMQGKEDKETVYYNDPLECAEHWHSLGAKRLHLVDLDGAFSGKRTNFQIISKLIKNYPLLEIQVGGGIRDEKSAQAYLEQAATSYIIIGTLALQKPLVVKRLIKYYPGRIYISLDIKKGNIYYEGWKKQTNTSVDNLLNDFALLPLAGFIVTDIKNDGMLSGVDVKSFVNVAKLTSLPIIAAGGIADLQDIRLLKSSGKISAVICGKSLYENTLDLRRALDI